MRRLLEQQNNTQHGGTITLSLLRTQQRRADSHTHSQPLAALAHVQYW